MLAQACASRLFGGFDVDLNVVIDGDQEAMTIAGLRDDVVVFDASVEDEKGSNYKATQMWPCTMDHFLVVSRTRLPLNFLPFHDGGTPETSEVIAVAPYALPNERLVQWIERQVERMGERLPRLPEERMGSEPSGFWKNREQFIRLTERIIEASLARRRASAGRAVFISYLSRYSAHSRKPATVGGRHVEDLVRYIRSVHESVLPDIAYFPPGSLSNEFMTEHRRWQILAMIDARLRRSTEVWIFETDDYYDSWWTRAELASLAYLRHFGDLRYQKAFPQVVLCRVQNGDFVHRSAPPDFIQHLTDPVARAFGRYLSNSDPLTMGLESVKNMKRLRGLPRSMQWLTYKSLEWMIKILMPDSSLLEQDSQDKARRLSMNFERFREMLNSPVFGDKFWIDRIVACPTCSRSNNSKESFDVERFMSHGEPGLKRVSPIRMAAILGSGNWQCEECGHRFTIVEEERPQFRWWPARLGRPTGPGGVYVERLPVYSFSRCSGRGH